jgi:hypothetical protein
VPVYLSLFLLFYYLETQIIRSLQFNTPVQLGPLSPSTPLTHARTFTIPIQQDDILILASDGLSDNLWDEEVLDEVVRFRRSFLPSSPAPSKAAAPEGDNGAKPSSTGAGLLGRRTLAGMLSEALCSRARRVSERRPQRTSSAANGPGTELLGVDEFEVPFARRAREQGKIFRGGKVDGEHFFPLVVYLCFSISYEQFG